MKSLIDNLEIELKIRIAEGRELGHLEELIGTIKKFQKERESFKNTLLFLDSCLGSIGHTDTALGNCVKSALKDLS